MTDAPAPKKPARKPRARTAPAQQFQPISAPVGSKEILSPANQVIFYNMIASMTPEQVQAVTLVLNAISTPPLWNDGYRKFFRFWRTLGPQLNTGNVKL